MGIKGFLQKLWLDFQSIASNPWKFLKNIHDKSPLVMLLAVVFIVQPIVSFIIDAVENISFIEEKLDPSQRPVTEAELKIVNSKIDYLEANMIPLRAGMPLHGMKTGKPMTESQYDQMQDRLTKLQNRLNKMYIAKHGK